MLTAITAAHGPSTTAIKTASTACAVVPSGIDVGASSPGTSRRRRARRAARSASSPRAHAPGGDRPHRTHRRAEVAHGPGSDSRQECAWCPPEQSGQRPMIGKWAKRASKPWPRARRRGSGQRLLGELRRPRRRRDTPSRGGGRRAHRPGPWPRWTCAGRARPPRASRGCGRRRRGRTAAACRPDRRPRGRRSRLLRQCRAPRARGGGRRRFRRPRARRRPRQRG